VVCKEFKTFVPKRVNSIDTPPAAALREGLLAQSIGWVPWWGRGHRPFCTFAEHWAQATLTTQWKGGDPHEELAPGCLKCWGWHWCCNQWRGMHQQPCVEFHIIEARVKWVGDCLPCSGKMKMRKIWYFAHYGQVSNIMSSR
jgi:hypothetical protein